MNTSNWYKINKIEEVDFPSIALYKKHLLLNIEKILEITNGDASELMVHVKTNKITI